MPKDDLLRGCFRLLRVQLAAAGDPDGLAFGAAVFAHAAERRAVYRALAGGPGGRVAVEEITGIVTNRLRRYPLRHPRGSRLPRDMQQRYVLSTFLTVLTWWLQQEPELPAQEGEKTFRTLVGRGLELERPIEAVLS